MSSALRNLGHDHSFNPFKSFHHLDFVEKGGVGVVRTEGCGNGEGKGRVRGRREKERKGNRVISNYLGERWHMGSPGADFGPQISLVWPSSCFVLF